MRFLIIIITAFLFCYYRGVKDNPEYQSQNVYNKKIKVI